MQMKFNVLVKRFRWIAFSMLLLVAIIGCSALESGLGGSSGDLTGTFLDSPVAGLAYKTPAGSGITNADGKFQYNEGETVTFSIGGLVLGSAVGKPVLTPQSIVAGAKDAKDQRVVNICVLLQTLDQDGNLNNGIQITPAVAATVSQYAGSINFNQATSAFAADAKIKELVAALNKAGAFTSADSRPRAIRKAAAAQEHFERSISERNIVKTQYGAVKGYAATPAAWQYLGIPYAKPPIGDLRWRVPQAPVAWSGVRDAIAWADQAAQNPAYEPYGEGGMSEDCLYLNISAPKDAKNLPVMVFFHGGAYMILTGNSKSYNNAASLPKKGVVLVTVNHRLGAFGYMAHPELSKESGYNGSGNYGQLDLIASLKWVKDNIEAFGGNPNNVTIFGQSGGGAKVISLMASPLAKGLFHKAICESGMVKSSDNFMQTATLAAAEATGTDLAKRLGVTTIAQMRAKSWTDVAMADAKAFGVSIRAYMPNIDNSYQTASLEKTIKAGLVNDVPFLAGNTTVDSFDGMDLTAGLVEQMPWRSASSKAPQYVYKFKHVPPGWDAKGVKAYHGMELVYIFNSPTSLVVHQMLGLTGLKPDQIGDLNNDGKVADPTDIFMSAGYGIYDVRVTQNMMTMWANFARSGDPTFYEPILKWEPYTKANGYYMEIGDTMELKSGLESAFKNNGK